MQFSLAGTFSQPVYKTLLIAVAGGFVWIGDATGTILKAATGQTTPQMSSTQAVSMAYISGVVYIVDGSSTVHTYTIATDTVSTLVATAGVDVGGGSTSAYNLCCNWRGRLTLAGDSGNPQAYYMSRMGTPSDWDYSQTDPAAAFSGNLGKAGLIGEPITALIPFSDDLLKFGCSHSLWMMQGDPLDGGTVVNVSNQLGIVGKDAWCVDPAGTLWFVATGGLFHVRPAWEAYRPPEAVSLQSVNQNFTGLDPSLVKTSLVFDADLHYLHILVTPVSGAAGTHLTMDARSLGQDSPPAFWPQQFSAVAGPYCACVFFGDGNPNNRRVLFGGNDGYIRNWNDIAYDDDQTAISASITLGPFAPFPGEAGTLIGTTIDLGEVPISNLGTNTIPSSTALSTREVATAVSAGGTRVLGEVPTEIFTGSDWFLANVPAFTGDPSNAPNETILYSDGVPQTYTYPQTPDTWCFVDDGFTTENPVPDPTIYLEWLGFLTGVITVDYTYGSGGSTTHNYTILHTPQTIAGTTVYVDGIQQVYNPAPGAGGFWYFATTSTGSTASITPTTFLYLSSNVPSTSVVTVTYQYTSSTGSSTGTNPWNAEVLLAAGPDAYAVTEALGNSQNPHPIPLIQLGTLDRRQKTFRQRLRGGWFTITLRNLVDNTFFSFESARLEFVASGKNRERR